MAPKLAHAARFAGLGGIVAGLGVSPHVGEPPLPVWACAALLAACLACAPRGRARPGPLTVGAWLGALALACALAGGHLGAARTAALERGALALEPGTRIALSGYLTQVPRATEAGQLLVVATERGRIAVLSQRLPAGLCVGCGVRARGVVRMPPAWQRDWLARLGAVRILAGSARATPARRGGLAGALDSIRLRAERALEAGAAPPAAALLRGFVLGQDDRIAEPVREEFRRSGLAHILAVSGQNVALLIALATPILALSGVPLGARRWLLIALVALYVPVAGAGPSIQRAGVMGIAGILAALAGRPASRWYALGLAAAATLALDPRASADIGWQLSFAAVVGLALLAAPLARALGARPGAGPLRRALAEGAAMTLAATVATAPLIAHHFGVVSLTTLLANLVALPAVAPAMWLGMLAAAAGQLSPVAAAPLSFAGGHCAAFIAWVAHALGSPQAQLEVRAPAPLAVATLSACWLAALALAARWLRRRRGLSPSRRALAAAGAALALAALALFGARLADRPAPPAPFELVALDVGQGDAILLRAAGAPPLLIDTGPPEGEVAARLDELGIERLGALLLTHGDRDHAGALREVLAAAQVERLLVAPGALGDRCAALACPPVRTLAAGARLRAGSLRLDVLWPPRDAAPAAEPNARSLVATARWRGFRALLTGDAEAEQARYEPGPVDVLKVAHHGSADAGLGALLERTRPRAAIVSVGRDNPYGHPDPGTLAELERRGIRVYRTDRHGTVRVRVFGNGWTVE
jgi:competence protein ComEC